MSRSARCLFALGLSVSLAAACGDDDGDATNIGGSGGGAGTAGAAGRAGSAGTGGTAGTGGGAAGTAGTGGSAGTGGAAGAAGTAGTAGTGGGAGAAGTGGTGEVPDAGPDAAEVVDSGAPDSGVNGDCPDFTTEAEGIAGGVGQNVVISRVEFTEGGARVTFRGVGDGTFDFDFTSLCVGETVADDCVVFDDGFDPDDVLAVDEELSVFVPDLDPAGGELAVTNNDELNLIAFAYVAWGEESGSGLETAAAGSSVWTLGDFVEVDGDNTIYGNGDADTADGYGVCTGDGDTLD